MDIGLMAQMTFAEGAIAIGTALGVGIAAGIGGKKGWSIIIRPRGESEEKEAKLARSGDECTRRHTGLMRGHERIHAEAEKQQNDRYDTILRGLDKLEVGLEKGLTTVHQRIDRFVDGGKD